MKSVNLEIIKCICKTNNNAWITDNLYLLFQIYIDE